MRTAAIVAFAAVLSLNAQAQDIGQVFVNAPVISTAGVVGGSNDIQLHAPGGLVLPELHVHAVSENPTTGAVAQGETRVAGGSILSPISFLSTAFVRGGDPLDFATADSNDFTLRIAFTTPSFATLRIESEISASGSGHARTEVDVDDDGQIDLVGRAGHQSVLIDLPDAVTSAVVRVRLGARASGANADQRARVSLTVLVRSTVTSITEVAPRCTFNGLLVGPLFDGSTLFRCIETEAAIPILVLSTVQASIPLPASLAPLGCTLVPMPDILLPMRPNALNSPVSEAILPRITQPVPLDVFAQAVTLDIGRSRVTVSPAFQLSWR